MRLIRSWLDSRNTGPEFKTRRVARSSARRRQADSISRWQAMSPGSPPRAFVSEQHASKFVHDKSSWKDRRSISRCSESQAVVEARRRTRMKMSLGQMTYLSEPGSTERRERDLPPDPNSTSGPGDKGRTIACSPTSLVIDALVILSTLEAFVEHHRDVSCADYC
jgi:hypothetical protein